VVLLSLVTLSVLKRQERKGDNNSVATGDFTQTVARVKTLTACHVFSVADRPVAGDSLDRLKGPNIAWISVLIAALQVLQLMGVVTGFEG
jgi:hypothetical protein